MHFATFCHNSNSGILSVIWVGRKLFFLYGILWAFRVMPLQSWMIIVNLGFILVCNAGVCIIGLWMSWEMKKQKAFRKCYSCSALNERLGEFSLRMWLTVLLVKVVWCELINMFVLLNIYRMKIRIWIVFFFLRTW